ncbi:hypothetical protein DBV05_g3883 [Lasiodiplodia theobromae]|uniref:C2H2-type domain-containing protein n=1 Tax=Lasiodiplodia theobromae TaxID=45133 RepID=A0A5N5DHP3_9PEZI|nr:hypothetical protein DBV05_g3883 [Lasiodiplodia theobromae]
MVPVDDKTKNMDVVQPLSRKYALRRSAYEVKTIARDVLVATGKHPEMRPLNGHLEILKENFKRVDNTSDLSTLRWDLIDPGDPPPEALTPNAIEIEDEDADDEEEDVQEQPHPRPTQPEPKAAPSYQASPSNLQAVPSRPVPSPTSQQMSKRKGRPPKLSAPGATDARDARATPSTRDRERERASSSTFSTPNKDQSPMASTPVGYSAFRQSEYGPDGQPLPKKKGRPVGWRKSLHSKEAQAKAAGLPPQPFSASRASASRPSGLRASQSSNGVVLIESRSPDVSASTTGPVSYIVYKCEWEDCSAELHNMATLKKHVQKFHHGQNAQQKWPCFWSGCEENERYIDKRTGKPNGFRVEEDLEDHIEFAHLGPKLWQLGDGHAGGLSESHDSASEAYLSDTRTGKIVTPLVAPSKEVLAAVMPALSPVPRRPGRPKIKTDEERALDFQAALERKKKLVGPGLDRGGARLPNQKRRMGFIDDEDFEEVVSDSN